MTRITGIPINICATIGNHSPRTAQRGSFGGGTSWPSFRHILTKSANGVETITLNRPDKRNALCPLLIDELTQALNDCEASDCGVVILTGAGPAFARGSIWSTWPR